MIIDDYLSSEISNLGFEAKDPALYHRKYISADGDEILTIIYADPIKVSLEFPIGKGISIQVGDEVVNFPIKGEIVVEGNTITYYTPKGIEQRNLFERGKTDEIPTAVSTDYIMETDPISRINAACKWAKTIQYDNNYIKEGRAKN